MWRVRLDTAADKVVFEVRDADVLLAYFFVLDVATGQVQQPNLNPSAAWWQGIEDIQDHVLLLHGYGDRKTGQHKGITALDTRTGAALWEKDELAFYGLCAEGVLTYQADAPEKHLAVLELHAGSLLKQGITPQQAALEAEHYSRQRYAACVYPALYKEGEAYFEEVSSFLRAVSGAESVVAVEYAEAGSYVLVSYYERAASGELDNFVAVYDLEGNLCLKVKLGSGLSGIGSDTFFIFNLNLYLLQNKHVLQVYRLKV